MERTEIGMWHSLTIGERALIVSASKHRPRDTPDSHIDVPSLPTNVTRSIYWQSKLPACVASLDSYLHTLLPPGASLDSKLKRFWPCCLKSALLFSIRRGSSTILKQS